MGWNQREEEQEAVESVVKVLIAAIILCAVFAAFSFSAMEKADQPLTLKDRTAAIQARWEARARAQQEVQR